MRYVRKQITTQIIADEVVDDVEVIKGILKTFNQVKTDVSISYRKNKMDMLSSHERVRIVSVFEDTFDITVINTTSSMIVRKIPISNIEYLASTISPSEIFLKKDCVSKGDTLDMS